MDNSILRKRIKAFGALMLSGFISAQALPPVQIFALSDPVANEATDMDGKTTAYADEVLSTSPYKNTKLVVTYSYPKSNSAWDGNQEVTSARDQSAAATQNVKSIADLDDAYATGFDHWATDVGKVYESDGEFSVSCSLTAVYSYTITYENMDGATNHADNPSTFEVTFNDYENNTTVGLNDPGKENSAFLGWHVGSADGDVITSFVKTNYNTADGITLYAEWDDMEAPDSTVSIDDWTYGEDASVPEPDCPNDYNTDNITYFYKVRGAADTTYSNNVPTAAGNYTLKAVFPADVNYLSTTATADFTIEKRPLTVTGVTIQNKDYDGTVTATVTGKTFKAGDKVGNDEVDVPITAVFANANAGENKAVTLTYGALTGAAKGNYELSEESVEEAQGNINKLDITLGTDYTNDTISAVIDGQQNISGHISITGAINNNDRAAVAAALGYAAGGNKISLNGSTVTFVSAGNDTITVSFAGNTNYNAADNVVIAVNIAKKDLTNAAVNILSWKVGEYDADVNSPAVTGLPNDYTGGDDIVYEYKASNAADGTYSGDVPEEVGNYTVRAAIPEDDKYNGKNVTANFTIANVNETYTVIFKDGDTVLKTIEHVELNSLVEAPDPGQKQGKIFAGWFVFPELTERWYPETRIINNITLCAKWDDEVIIHDVPHPVCPDVTGTSPASEPSTDSGNEDNNDQDNETTDTNDNTFGYYIEIIEKDVSESTAEHIRVAANKSGKDFTGKTVWEINLYRTVNDVSTEKLSKADEPLLVSIKLSESMKTFVEQNIDSLGILRIHDGVASLLPCSYDKETGTLTFYSDLFSDFAPVHDKRAGENNPHTGAPFSGIMIMMMFAAASAGTAAAAGKKRKKQ